MSKYVKKLEIDAMTATLNGVRDMVLIAPDRIDSELEYNMRKTLRDKKVAVKMVKNTLARKILGEAGVTVADKHWSGPTLVAYGADSIKDLANAVDALIKDVVKKNPKNEGKIKVKTAVADGAEVALDVAMKMPTRLEAIGEIIGMILGPGSAIAGALTGPGGAVASQVATLADKKDEPATAA